jgi:hypothetical protein
VERFDRNIGAVDAALQKAPEVLQAVGMNLAVNVLDSVIDNAVLEFV